MKAVLSCILFFIAYACLSGGVAMSLLIVRGRWPESVFPPAGYLALFAVAGAGALWAGIRLWPRWRIALGVLALILGFGGILEATRLNADASTSLMASNALGILAGVWLLLASRFSARK